MQTTLATHEAAIKAIRECQGMSDQIKTFACNQLGFACVAMQLGEHALACSVAGTPSPLVDVAETHLVDLKRPHLLVVGKKPQKRRKSKRRERKRLAVGEDDE